VKIGIVGPDNAGKTSVFQCITGLTEAQMGGKNAHLGVVRVPDERLDVLSAMYQPKKTTPAEVTFVDLGQNASQAERLSSLTGALADAEALAVVCGAFMEDRPRDSLESYLLDLALADLSLVENRLEHIAKDVQRGKKEARADEPLMQRLQEILGDGRRVADLELAAEETKALRGYQFVTGKPTVVIANVAEKDLGNGVAQSIAGAAGEHGLPSCEMCCPLELEVSQLQPEDRKVFMADYGMSASARDRFIRAAYEMTDLISFFTVGADEVRAWSIPRGTPAPVAAGKIHSDIQQGFIRAEVVAYEDLAAAGSLAECRSQGTVRLEGKTYQIQDGDVIDFRFSV